MKRALVLAILATLVVVAPVEAKRKPQPHTLTATASVSVSDPVVGDAPVTFSWTGGDGGYIRIRDQCRLTYISTGIGDGSFTDWQPNCPGAATLQLLSSTGTSDAPVVLAETSYTVQ